MLRPTTRFNLLIRTLCLITLVASVPALGGTMPRLDGLIRNTGQWPSEVVCASRGVDCYIWVTTWGVVVDHFKVTKATGSIEGKVTFIPIEDVSGPTDVIVGTKRTNINIRKGRTQNSWLQAPLYDNVTVAYTQDQVLIEYASLPGGLVSQTTQSAINGRPYAVSKSVVYGVYLGASEMDSPSAVEYAASGKVYVTGSTREMVFPRIEGSYRKSIVGNTDGFVARLDPTLETVESYTLLGGYSDDKVTCVTTDIEDNVYIAGETTSSDFPITVGVSGQVHAGEIDGFVAMMDANLEVLKMSTFIGGNLSDNPVDIAVNTNGSIYVCGATSSTSNFPVTFPATVPIKDWWGTEIGTRPGGGATYGRKDGFVARVSQSGRIVNARYLGGEQDDSFTAITLDASSNPYLVGTTGSLALETAPTMDQWNAPGRFPYDTTFNGGETDAFVVRLQPDLFLSEGGDGTFSTYFGGDGDDAGYGIVVDNLGRAYVVGTTKSGDLPAENSWRAIPLGGLDIFLTQLSADGKSVMGCTYYGGSGDEWVQGATALPGTTSILLYGTTTSSDMPIIGAGSSDTRNGSSDAFLAVLSATSNSYTTLVSGSREDEMVSVSTDKSGDAYFLMHTTSDDLITTATLESSDPDQGVMYLGKHVFGTLSLTYPVGGEVVCKDKTLAFKWQGMGLSTNDRYAIDVSPDNGATWNNIVQGVNGTVYSWDPNTSPSTSKSLTARVRTQRGHSSSSQPFTISEPPAITSQTRNTEGCEGKTLKLEIKATGEKLTYAWYKDGELIPGQVQSTLDIASLDNSTAGEYRARINGQCQPSLTSEPIKLSIIEATLITQHPVSKVVKPGGSVVFTVVATGRNLRYQWYHKGNMINGATESELHVENILASGEGAYTCMVRGECGVVTSQQATITLDESNGVDEDIARFGFAIVAVPSVMSNGGEIVVVGTVNDDLALSVININGIEVWSTVISQGQTNVALPTSSLPAGAYMCVARTQLSVVTAKIQVID